jgi:hypothetical protein
VCGATFTLGARVLTDLLTDPLSTAQEIFSVQAGEKSGARRRWKSCKKAVKK